MDHHTGPRSMRAPPARGHLADFRALPMCQAVLQNPLAARSEHRSLRFTRHQLRQSRLETLRTVRMHRFIEPLIGITQPTLDRHRVKDDVFILVSSATLCEVVFDPLDFYPPTLTWHPLSVRPSPRVLAVGKVLKIATSQRAVAANDVADRIQLRLGYFTTNSRHRSPALLVPERANYRSHVPG
jgi:hypothetical protein